MKQQDLISAIESIEAEAQAIVAGAEQKAQEIRLVTRQELADLEEETTNRLATKRRDAEQARIIQREQSLKSAQEEAAKEGEVLREKSLERFDQAVKNLVERSLKLDGHR